MRKNHNSTDLSRPTRIIYYIWYILICKTVAKEHMHRFNMPHKSLILAVYHSLTHLNTYICICIYVYAYINLLHTIIYSNFNFHHFSFSISLALFAHMCTHLLHIYMHTQMYFTQSLTHLLNCRLSFSHSL